MATKAKKFKKSLDEVSFPIFPYFFYISNIYHWIQDTNAKSRAETEAKNTDEKMTKLRTELDSMESTLEKEESQLEKLRDSLKGKSNHYFRLFSNFY